MRMIEGFNKTIDYIESVMKDEIDEKRIMELSGYSYAMFRRIFSILTETTLSEYIRARKLTEAAKKIRETDEKIIEIAFEYGYDSPDSFGLAFKNFHGYTPSEVRKGKPFRAVSRVRLMLTVKGGNNMNITIQKKEAFKVAGINAKNIEPSSCPEVWKELFSKYSPEKLENLGNGQSYGICHDMKNTKKINYMACYDVRDRKWVLKLWKWLRLNMQLWNLQEKYLIQFMRAGSIFLKCFFLNRDTGIQENLILKSTQKGICTVKHIKWSSGFLS